MRSIPLTRSSIVSPIATFLARIGAPVERLLTRAGLPPWILEDPEGLIPTLSVVRLLKQAAWAEGIEDLGLRAGYEARLDTLGTLGHLICSAPTVGDALAAEIRHHRTFSSNGRMWLVPRGDQVHLCQAFLHGFDEGWRQTDHYLLMLMLGLLRLGASPRWRPGEVHLQTGDARALRDFEPLSGARIDFAQPASAIVFPRAMLDARVLRSAGGSRRRDGEIDGWEASAPAGDFAGSVVQVVETLAWKRYPDVRLTAEILGTSVRTLQRHLAAAGVTHEALVGRARLATAAALLENTDAKILDIALDLGYSDHAHFTRAFRRWTGRSPQAFRRERRVRQPSSDAARSA
jgi:AraC-like DNA-binding protein